jgi:hypothetical protein
MIVTILFRTKIYSGQTASRSPSSTLLARKKYSTLDAEADFQKLEALAIKTTLHAILGIGGKKHFIPFRDSM